MSQQAPTKKRKAVVRAPRISRKNQITIPVSILKELNLRPGDRLQITTEPDGSLRLIPKRHVPDFHQLIGAVPVAYQTNDEMLADLRGEVGDD